MSSGKEEGRIIIDGTVIFEQLGEVVDGFRIYRVSIEGRQSIRAFPQDEEPHFDDSDMIFAVEEIRDDIESQLSIQWRTDIGLLDFANRLASYAEAGEPTPDNIESTVHGSFEGGDMLFDWDWGKYTGVVTSDVLGDVLAERSLGETGAVRYVEVWNGETGGFWTPDVIGTLTPLARFSETQTGLEASRVLFNSTRDGELSPSINVFNKGLAYALNGAATQ